MINQNIIIIILTIAVLTIIYKFVKQYYEPFHDEITTTGSVVPQSVRFSVNWSLGSSGQLPIMISQLGPPDLIDVNAGGAALWKKLTLIQRGFCWDSVALFDVPTYPITIAYAFPLFKIRGPLEIHKALYDIVDFNPAVNFDAINRRLIAKGYTMQEVVVLLTITKRMLTKEITLQQARNLLLPSLESIDRYNPNYNPEIYNKFQVELCTLGFPNETTFAKYGGISPTNIYTLKSGGLEKEVRNMDIIGWSS